MFQKRILIQSDPMDTIKSLCLILKQKAQVFFPLVLNQEKVDFRTIRKVDMKAILFSFKSQIKVRRLKKYFFTINVYTEHCHKILERITIGNGNERT